MANRASVQRPANAPQGRICQFKLVLLGESAVGKSSLVLRFVKGQFHEYQESTIGGWAIVYICCSPVVDPDIRLGGHFMWRIHLAWGWQI